MTNNISNTMDMNRLLLEMRAMKAQSQAFGGSAENLQPGLRRVGEMPTSVQENSPINTSPRQSFNRIFESAIDKVNDVQQASSDISTGYLRGDENIDVTDVMIASQKAGVAFDAAVQVRNKFVEAYRDVMNMPI